MKRSDKMHQHHGYSILVAGINFNLYQEKNHMNQKYSSSTKIYLNFLYAGSHWTHTRSTYA